jgi:hypothetical protein
VKVKLHLKKTVNTLKWKLQKYHYLYLTFWGKLFTNQVFGTHKFPFNFSGEQAKRAAQEKVEAQAAQQAAMQAIESESKQPVITEPSAVSQINFGAYSHRAVSFLARNFYNLKYVALVLAFCINFMLLFYRVICNLLIFS